MFKEKKRCEKKRGAPDTTFEVDADLVMGTTDGHVSFWSVGRSAPFEARGDDIDRSFFRNGLGDRGGDEIVSEPFGAGSGVSCVRTFASDAVRRSRITNVLWDSCGAILVTSDSARTVCIWRGGMGNRDVTVAGHGCKSTNVILVVQYQKSSSGGTVIVFICNAPGGSDDAENVDTQRDAGSHAKSRHNDDAAFFFFGTESGSVFLAYEHGFCTEVYSLSPPSSIDHLYHHAG